MHGLVFAVSCKQDGKDDLLYSCCGLDGIEEQLDSVCNFSLPKAKIYFWEVGLFSSFNQPSINFLRKQQRQPYTSIPHLLLLIFFQRQVSSLPLLFPQFTQPKPLHLSRVLPVFCEPHHFNLLIIIMQKKSKAVQILKGRLFWISDSEAPKNIPKSFYFNIDNDLVYDSFNEDFGPLNLGKTWKYVTELEKLLAHPQYKTNQIYHFTGTQPDKAANSAYLICAFQIIVLGYSAKKAHEPFKNITFRPFRDAGYAECTYKCTLLDCLGGLEYAIKLGWFNYKTFNLAEYEHYERIENGDLNWIIPQKFIAFSSPSDKTIDKHGNRTFTPQDYAPIFKKLGAKAVVRLNNKTYEANDFVKNGIGHHQLYFPDGSVPSMEIVNKFLQIAEETNGALAIHCKAGLGRTGTLIACYAMKHYHFPAAEFIGWIRIARPGSILGPQQNYLIEIEKTMRELGANSPIWKEVKELIDEKELSHHMKNMSLNEMSKREVEIMHNGEAGQGEGLVSAKLKKETLSKPITGGYREKSNSKSSSSSGKYSPHSSVSSAL